MSGQPNILFVLTDQMRGEVMNCAGVENVITPNLDAFAAEGTRFTRAVSNTPLCGPARATIMTGLHAMSHHLVSNDIMLSTDFRCLAECLNDGGYACGYIGKWHIDSNDRGIFVPPGPRRRGFDDLWAAYNCNHDYFEGYYYLDDNPDPVWIDGYEPLAQTDLAVDYLRRRAKEEEPFFLFVSYGPPHSPYDQVPEDHLAMYPADEIEFKANASECIRPHRLAAARRRLAGYYAHVSALDACFGRLLDALDRENLCDNTIVIFTSDHGDLMYSHGPSNRKHEPWFESVNIPFLVRWPGRVPAGRASDGLISLVDVMPTLLSLCGAAVPEGVEGIESENLAALVLGDESASPESVYISAPVTARHFGFEAWRGVLTRRYTYARYADGPRLLFDDQDDPMQLDNLADSTAHAALRERMEAMLRIWLERTDDSFEPSAAVEGRFYRGSKDGVMPYFENDVIRRGKAERRRAREADGV